MDFKNVLLENRNGIGWITVNRPARMNALDLDTIAEIESAIFHHESDDDVKVVAITGAGAKAFVSGADIAAMKAMTPAEAERFAVQGHACMNAIEGCRKVVIAAVNGFALGGGTELILACDFAIASDEAKFGLPEVKLGIYPGFGGTQRLPRQVGLARARELIFSGRVIDAAEALRIGLVCGVVSGELLIAEVERRAAEIAANGPVAVMTAKWLINEGMNLSLKQALESERTSFIEVFRTKDHAEGFSAFLEKRKPVFKGN